MLGAGLEARGAVGGTSDQDSKGPEVQARGALWGVVSEAGRGPESAIPERTAWQ